MQSLRSIIDETDSKSGKVFHLSIQGLILLSMICLTVETLPNLSPTVRTFLHVLEAMIVFVFLAEYLLRISVAEKKLAFIFSFMGLIDLLAIVPFFLTAGIDARSIRAIRLLRLFRILKLARYSQAMRRYHRALLLSKEEIVIFLTATAIVLFLSAVGIYHFEHEAQPEYFSSIFHSFWWAIVTLTTVGYGDCYPVTLGGRMFTFVVLLTGLGVVSVLTGLIASALTKARELEHHEQQDDETQHIIEELVLSETELQEQILELTNRYAELVRNQNRLQTSDA